MSNHSLFQEFNRETLSELAENLSLCEFPAGSTILQEGQKNDSLYCVIDGFCEARHATGGPDEGTEYYRPGDQFGFAALFGEAPHWCTVQVIEDTVCLRIPRSSFLHVFQESPENHRTVQQICNDRLQYDHAQTNTPGSLLAVMGAREKLGKTFFSQALGEFLSQEVKAEVAWVDCTHRPAPRSLEDLSDPTALESFLREEAGRPDLSVDVLSAPEPDRIHSTVLEQFLSMLRARYEYVLFTLPEEYAASPGLLLRASDHRFVLSGDEEDDRYQTRLLLEELEAIEGIDPSRTHLLLARLQENPSCPDRPNPSHFNQTISERLPNLTTEEVETYFNKGSPTSLPSDHPYRQAVRRIMRRVAHVSCGIALGAGAARGLTHIGVMDVWETNDLVPDVIAGSSIGALIGAGWALGRSGEEMKSDLRDFQEQGGMFTVRDLQVPPNRSLLGQRRIRDFLDGRFGDATFSDTDVPLRIQVTNLDAPQPQVLSEGLIADAVHASIAIPTIFKPVSKRNQKLVDGGVLQPLPIQALQQEQMDQIIAVNPLPPNEVLREQQPARREPPSDESDGVLRTFMKSVFPFGEGNILDIGMRSLQCMQSAYARFLAEQADLVLDPYVTEAEWYDFERYDLFIEQGRRSAHENLDRIRELVNP